MTDRKRYRIFFGLSVGVLVTLGVLALVGITVGWWVWLVWAVLAGWSGTDLWNERKKL